MSDHPERLTDPRLAALPGIAHGFFTRRGGVSEGVFATLNCGVNSGDDLGRVAENRRRAATALGIADTHLLTARQVHGADVVTVTEPWPLGDGPPADALVTAKTGIAVAVGAADCAPILFADPEARVVGAAHAGWGGAFKGVIEATVSAMVALGAQRNRIAAAIGPAIAQPSYEVGPEFRERFLSADQANARFFGAAKRPDHFLFDLTGYVTSKLRESGVTAITDLSLDTYSDPGRFFSFRRSTHRGEAEYGRMISAIALL